MKRFACVAPFLAGLIIAHGAQAKDCSAPKGMPTEKIVLVGELHGVAESPAFVLDTACALSKLQPTAIGLEIDAREQSRVEAYLRGKGTPSEQTSFLSSPFWSNARDGRGSKAMFELIERVRKLKSKNLTVFYFDDQPGGNRERNEAIAEGIRRFAKAHSTYRIMALMGNVHSEQSVINLSTGAIIIPSGALLSDLKPATIELIYPAGTSWNCRYDGCKVRQDSTGRASQFPDGLSKIGPPVSRYYTFKLASRTASAPAGISK